MEKPPKCEKNGLKKGAWTAEEDQKLIDYVQEHGHGRWRNVPKNAGLKRCGKSCRLRWKNYLKPDIKRGRFSFEEEETIIQLHSILGNKWSTIAARLPGRTDNEIKNYWNTRIRKRLLRMGINPVTHSPRLDLLELSSILNSSLCNLSQLNVQSLLGADPAVNPNLLTLSDSLLLSQCKNMQFLPQNLEKDHFSNPYVQNELQTYQGNQPHNTLQEFQASTMWSNSSTPFSNDTQLMQANADQFSLNTANFSCQNSMPSWYQNNEDQFSNPAYSTVPLPEFSNQYFFNQIPSENQMFQSNNNNKTQNFGFGSVLSTPSSSSTPLNSSMTYINGSSTEDERDSYCNNVMFEIQNSLDVDGLMGAYRS